MKTKFLSFLSSLLLVLFLISCTQKENLEPNMVSCEVLDCAKLPKVKATVRHNLCGVGVWGSFVLELADGTIIQPWSATTDEAKNFKPQANQVIAVNFTERAIDDSYPVRCEALGEYEKRISKVVHILCVVTNPLD